MINNHLRSLRDPPPGSELVKFGPVVEPEPEPKAGSGSVCVVQVEVDSLFYLV